MIDYFEQGAPIVRCSGCGVILSDRSEVRSETYVHNDDGSLDYIELFCGECASQGMGECGGDHDDVADCYEEPDEEWYDASTLASIGWGTDEDYGYFGDYDEF